jgi:hypothetical protein
MNDLRVVAPGEKRSGILQFDQHFHYVHLNSMGKT